MPLSELAQGYSVVTLGLIGSLIAGLMTGLGALPVLFTRNIPRRVESLLLGFGGGVMLAATAFSLIVPGIEAAERQTGSTTLSALIVAAAMLLGGLALWAANLWIAHRDFGEGPYGLAEDRLKGIWLFVVAITLHNFPEGMAVGVGFAGGDVANGTSLAVGIGLQKCPRGSPWRCRWWWAATRRWPPSASGCSAASSSRSAA